MSEEVPTGLLVAEKLVGVTLIILGAVVTYLTAIDPPTGDSGTYSSIFIIVGVILLIIGILLLIAKTR
jgi:hypothetical protein